jgi:type VI protein secretion system component VasF
MAAARLTAAPTPQQKTPQLFYECLQLGWVSRYRKERRRIGAMHANIYRQQQELQKQAAKEFAAINNWRYTAKKSGAWYPRITTERMIFTTTSAHY